MAEKKYYWLRLKKDFFNQREMKKLRKLAGGDTYTIIYLKMMLLSLEETGLILYAETETDIYEQLSIELDEDVEDIKLTISFLLTNNLVEINKKNDLFLSEVKELIDSESSSAKRVRKYREKSREIGLLDSKALHCNSDVTKCNTDIDIELDIDIDKEIDIEKDIEIKKDKEKDLNTLGVLNGLNEKHNIKKDKDIPKIRIKDIQKNNFKFDDLEKMLLYFKVEWNNPKMKKYLRVSTLYNEKFISRVLEAKEAELDLRMLATNQELNIDDIEIF